MAADPIIPVLTRIRSTFTTKRGSETGVYLNHYAIETDESLFPVEDIKTVEGWYMGSQLESAF